MLESSPRMPLRSGHCRWRGPLLTGSALGCRLSCRAPRGIDSRQLAVISTVCRHSGAPKPGSKGRNEVIPRFKGGKIGKVAAPRPHKSKAAEHCRSPEPIAHIAYEQLAMYNLHFLMLFAITLHSLFGFIRIGSRIVDRTCPRILFNFINSARARRSTRSDRRLTRPSATPSCWVFLQGL